MLKKAQKKSLHKSSLLTNEQTTKLIEATDVILSSVLVSRRRVYFQNFMRGVFFSFGGIIGATLLLAIIIWLLSVFGRVPIIGPIFDTTRQSLQHPSSK